jgi:hypothetical protein
MLVLSPMNNIETSLSLRRIARFAGVSAANSAELVRKYTLVSHSAFVRSVFGEANSAKTKMAVMNPAAIAARSITLKLLKGDWREKVIGWIASFCDHHVSRKTLWHTRFLHCG